MLVPYFLKIYLGLGLPSSVLEKIQNKNRYFSSIEILIVSSIPNQRCLRKTMIVSSIKIVIRIILFGIQYSQSKMLLSETMILSSIKIVIRRIPIKDVVTRNHNSIQYQDSS